MQNVFNYGNGVVPITGAAPFFSFIGRENFMSYKDKKRREDSYAIFDDDGDIVFVSDEVVERVVLIVTILIGIVVVPLVVLAIIG